MSNLVTLLIGIGYALIAFIIPALSFYFSYYIDRLGVFVGIIVSTLLAGILFPIHFIVASTSGYGFLSAFWETWGRLSVGAVIILFVLIATNEAKKLLVIVCLLLALSLGERWYRDYQSQDGKIQISNASISQPILGSKIPVVLKDKFIKDHESTYIAERCDNVRIKTSHIDLNGDGIEEYILLPEEYCGTMIRGASGNGPILVYQQNGIWGNIGEFQGNAFSILSTRTKGFMDLSINYQTSVSSGSRTTYVWSGSKYLEKSKERYGDGAIQE